MGKPEVANSNSLGCSARHGGHQLAQKLTNATLPRRRSSDVTAGYPANGTCVIAGALEPIKVERNSSFSDPFMPRKNNRVKTAKISSGAMAIGENLAIL